MSQPEKPDAQGQWAFNEREPLNPNERFKYEDDGLNVRERITSIYARDGFSSINPDDLHGRFRWWGLYTQRRQGVEGRRTGSADLAELTDEHFMLRIRLDGGRLTTGQLRVIGEVSQRYARNTADITDRQNIQLHWIRVEDVPAIWDRLEEIGLSTVETCGDVPRVVLGSPVAGVAEDEIIDGTWAVEEIRRRYIGSPEYSNLPRKFKTAISGSPTHDVVHELNDLSFVGVRHPEHGPGFDLWIGGGLSTNPILAQRLGAWVPLSQVPEVWAGVIGVFRDYGYRKSRHRARLKFLVADWGVAEFRRVLEEEYLGWSLLDGPPPVAVGLSGDHVGVHRQRDGRFYVGLSPLVGRVSGTVLAAVADAAEAHGSGRVNTTAQQKLLILDVPEDRVASLVTHVKTLGLSPDPHPVRRHTIACTGLEFCKLALVETKARAASLVEELESQLPELSEPIGIHINGCPNSCARVQVADIGFRGQLVRDSAGQQVEGYQVHLGGGLGLDAGFGRKLRGHKVTAAGLAEYTQRVIRAFLNQRSPGERFAQWVARADEQSLR